MPTIEMPLSQAIDTGFELFEDLRDELEELRGVEFDIKPLDSILELDPPALDGLLEYLRGTTLNVQDYRAKRPTHSNLRDTALDFWGAAREVLEERRVSFEDYARTVKTEGERPAGFAEPWTADEYQVAAVVLGLIIRDLDRAIQFGQNLVFPEATPDSGDEAKG